MDPAQLSFLAAGADAAAALASDATPSRRLPPDYPGRYLRLVAETVAARYDALLAPAERVLVATVGELAARAPEAVSLWARLAGRRGALVRRDAVRGPELPDDEALAAALATLAGAGLVGDADGADAAEVVPLLRGDEAERLWAELGDPGVPRRTGRELRAALLRAGDRGRVAREAAAVVRPLRVLGRAELRVLELLFFGDTRHGLATLVRCDLGRLRFEGYAVDPQARRFATRADVEAALAFAVLAEAAEGDPRGEEAGWVEEATSWVPFLPALAPAVRRAAERLLGTAAAALERRGEIPEAEAVWGVLSLPPARERRARLLARRGALEEATALVEQIAAAPRDETEAAFARSFGPRLARRAGAPRTAPLPEPEIPVRELELVATTGVSIEAQAAAALAAAGEPAVFAENGLWSALFGLALWDEIFAPVPGAFEHPYQHAPLDLSWGNEFRLRREATIADRLAALAADPTPGPALLATWDRKHGIANPFVSWDDRLHATLVVALSRLGGAAIAAVLDRASRDPRRYLRGLPDLFVLTREAPGFALLEVKGPGDTLRPEQRAWLCHLAGAGVPAAVLRVRWSVAPFLPRRVARAEQLGLLPAEQLDLLG